MTRQIAVLDVRGRRVVVPSRKHTGHKTTAAALRALDKAASRFTFDTRGIVYPSNVDGTDARNWTTCVAL